MNIIRFKAVPYAKKVHNRNPIGSVKIIAQIACACML